MNMARLHRAKVGLLPLALSILNSSCQSERPASAPIEGSQNASESDEMPEKPGQVHSQGSASAPLQTAVAAKENSPSQEPDSQITPTAPGEAAEPPRCPEGMKLVPGGKFTTAVNHRELQVIDLCVDPYETSSTEYAQCVEAGACTTNQVLCSEQATWKASGKENHPMVCVDFSQAVDYCTYRHKRLPETGEWEWVARGGEAAYKYPWGNEEPNEQLCWQGKKPLNGTCPIGSFPEGQSPQGIFDLAGSVHEFTTTAQDATGIIRIARGGSWKEGDPKMMWPGRIGGFETSYRCSFLGIRCVIEASPPAQNTGVPPKSSAAQSSQNGASTEK